MELDWLTLPLSLTIATMLFAAGTLGFALLNFIRSGMGQRIERLEASEKECQDDRLRLERERIQLMEEIIRLQHPG